MPVTSFQILCPNGRRQNVKVGPNTKILQVLDEVCVKQDFVPSADYELRHGQGTKKTLDVTLTVRLSGLANLAKLELVKAEKSRCESTVVVGLQLDNGQRLCADFMPAATLWHIVHHWEKENMLPVCPDGLHPVCIYLNEEIVGQYALENATLHSLGLTAGNAILRLNYRSVDDKVLSDIRNSIDKKRSQQSRAAAKRTAEQDAERNTTHSITTGSLGSDTSTFNSNGSSSISGHSDAPLNDQERHMDSRMDATTVASEEQLMSRESSEHSMDSIPTYMAMARDFLPESFGANVTRLQRPNEPEPEPQPEPQPQFTDFKFPESTKGQCLYQNEISVVNEDDFRPCEREAVLYQLNTSSKDPQTEDNISDTFFDITEDDLKKMMNDLKQKVNEADKSMLLTSDMRLARHDALMDKYDRCVIRIHFPDKNIIQATFRPRETVFVLRKFIVGLLASQSMEFYLYTTPPKYVLDDLSQTLFDANMVPLAVVYLGCDTHHDHYLSIEILSTQSTSNAANEIVHKHMDVKQSASVPSCSTSKPSRSNVSSNSKSKSTIQQSSSSSKSKVPKWLQAGRQ